MSDSGNEIVRSEPADVLLTTPGIREDMGLGEFLVAMQTLAGISQRDVSEYFGVSQQSVSRWMSGKSTPAYDSESTLLIENTFGLTKDQTRSLIDNNAPWDQPVSKPGPKPGRRNRVRNESAPQEPHAAKMLVAFAVRAENGPPLNEIEADLIKFLVQQGLESPET